jgi:hypothetical protein
MTQHEQSDAARNPAVAVDITAAPPVPFSNDPKMTDAGPNAPAWTRYLPVAVNDTYGDPLIPEQIGNTVSKLAALRDHQAPVALFTKAGYDEDVLARLSMVADNRNVVVLYSLTGLDEGGIDFPTRLRFITELSILFPRLFILVRPIIRHRNDSPEMLQKIAEAAAKSTGQLVLGGIHDSKKRKRLEPSVEERLLGYCDALGVRAFHKTSCAAAWVRGGRCCVHDLGRPQRVATLRSLDYDVTADEERVYLDAGSTGDINFIRMVSSADVHVDRLLSNYNLLTLPTPGLMLEAESSWYVWSDNIETCLDCNYCIIKQIEYLKTMRVRIGVHPTRIPEVVAHGGRRETFEGMNLTRLPKNKTEHHTYADVRTQQPCRAGFYEPPALSR